MTETREKKKIIKKPKSKKPKAKKPKSKQTQKQTQKQVINIFPGGLRNPRKTKNPTLSRAKVYRPVNITQMTNPFAVEQRLYSKIADEERNKRLAFESEQRQRQALFEQQRIQEEENKRLKDLDEQRKFKTLLNQRLDRLDSRSVALPTPHANSNFQALETIEREELKEELETEKQEFSNLFVGAADAETEPFSGSTPRPRSPEPEGILLLEPAKEPDYIDPIDPSNQTPFYGDDPLNEFNRQFRFTRSDLENDYSQSELIDVLERMRVSPTLFNKLVDDKFELKASKYRVINAIMKRKSEFAKRAKEEVSRKKIIL